LSALLVAALIAIASPQDGFVVREHRTFYDVRAHDLESLRKRMRALQLHGPNDDPSSGMTTQQMEVAYELEHVPEGCRMRDPVVTVDIEIVLPRLVTHVGVEVRKRWEKMLVGLTTHEDGHRENILVASRELYDALLALPPGECKALQRDARHLKEHVLLKLQIRDQRYDERTKHGVTQGSVL
jgi:predicted secreted Zn-dependent protease